MRRLGVLLVVLGLLVMAAPGMAQPPEPPEPPPPHPHMLVQRPEVELVEGVPHLVGFRKCVDLAGNRPVPLNAHHEHLHLPTGKASQALFLNAGHWVVPGAPVSPFADCAALEDDLPIPVG